MVGVWEVAIAPMMVAMVWVFSFLGLRSGWVQ